MALEVTEVKHLSVFEKITGIFFSSNYLMET